jgi:hypothetical protein
MRAVRDYLSDTSAATTLLRDRQRRGPANAVRGSGHKGNPATKWPVQLVLASFHGVGLTKRLPRHWPPHQMVTTGAVAIR